MIRSYTTPEDLSSPCGRGIHSPQYRGNPPIPGFTYGTDRGNALGHTSKGGGGGNPEEAALHQSRLQSGFGDSSSVGMLKRAPANSVNSG